MKGPLLCNGKILTQEQLDNFEFPALGEKIRKGFRVYLKNKITGEILVCMLLRDKKNNG